MSRSPTTRRAAARRAPGARVALRQVTMRCTLFAIAVLGLVAGCSSGGASNGVVVPTDTDRCPSAGSRCPVEDVEVTATTGMPVITCESDGDCTAGRCVNGTCSTGCTHNSDWCRSACYSACGGNLEEIHRGDVVDCWP